MKAYISLLLLFGLYYNAEADGDICRLFTDGTQLRQPGSCLEYITCEENISKVSACITPTLYSNAKQSCVEATALTDAEYCADRCAGKSDVWTADLTSCHGYYYCQNGVSIYGFCPKGYHFSETAQMCAIDTTSGCIDVADICQIAPNGVKFKNEASCKSYHTCTSGKLTTKDCGTGEYFDKVKGTCESAALTECAAHPYPKEVCGKDGSAKKGVFVADGVTCRGYFYCADLGYAADLAPAWGQCPEGKFFNSKTALCGDPKEIACSYNRCDGRGSRLVQSEKNDCHNFYDCVDHKPVAEYTCNGELFFDEEIQACAKKLIYYASCDMCTLNPTNSACK